MFRLLALALLALTLSTIVPAASAPLSNFEAQHPTAHLIIIYDLLTKDSFKAVAGHCSATAVGPHALLTAQHCFTNSNLIRVDQDKELTHISAAFIDGNDHVIYIVDRTFTSWAPVAQRALVVNERVHLWGNPGHNTDVYREGYFQKLDVVDDVDSKFLFQYFILPIYPGDSGSGVFDTTGHIIAVVSLGGKSADNVNLPLVFSQATLDIVTHLGA